MKKRFRLYAGIAACMMTLNVVAQESAPAPASPLTLNLDQCIAIALDKNPTIKVADMEIERVDYSKKEIIGQLFPKIDFSGTYSRTLAKQTMYLNMGALGGGAGAAGGQGEGEGEGNSSSSSSESKSSSAGSGIKMGLDNSYSLGFTASMPLVAPQLWKSIQLSETQILQNVEKARASRIALINQIENAYYAVMLAKDSHKVIESNYETAKLNASIYEAKYKVGTASEYDMLRSQVQVKNVEPELMQAEIAIKSALMQLKVLMGIDVATEITVANQLSDYQKDMYDNVMKIDRSLDKNSDLRSLDLQTEYLRKAVDVQKLAWAPTLALTGNYNWTSMSNGSPFKNFRWNPYSTIGLALSVPIYNGGQRYSKYKQAELATREMGFQRDNLVRSLNMQVDLQIDNIKKNVKQIATSAAGVEQAQKAHQIMQESFKIGAASYLNLRDAENALTSSKLIYYQAIYNYLVANSNLQYILGTAEPEKYENNKTALQ